MKKTFLTIIAIFALGLINLSAQKIGYCQIDKVITLLPEYEQAKAKLEGEMTDIQSQMEEMQVEFNNKYKVYTDNQALASTDAKKWSPTVQQLKEQELTQLQQRMQDFQSTVQQTLQQRQADLMQPISNKLDSVINVIMKENGYLFVIKDSTVISVNKSKCDDITPMIKTKLKIQ